MTFHIEHIVLPVAVACTSTFYLKFEMGILDSLYFCVHWTLLNYNLSLGLVVRFHSFLGSTVAYAIHLKSGFYMREMADPVIPA